MADANDTLQNRSSVARKAKTSDALHIVSAFDVPSVTKWLVPIAAVIIR